MKTLTSSLTAAQKAMGIALIKVVLTKAGEDTQTYTNEDRIIDVKHTEQEDSQSTDVLLDNSDLALTSLDLRGYDAIVSRGYRTSAGDEYSENPSQKCISQDLYSAGGAQACTLKLAGISNLLEADKASDDYAHDASSAKTVKDMITEVADGTAVTEDLIESQTDADTDENLRLVVHGVGQRLTIRNRTISKLAFRLKKTGSATGTITFLIKSSDEQTTYATKDWGDASGLTTSYAWVEVTLDTPVTINNEVFIYTAYTNGSGANYVLQEYQNSDVKANENRIYTDATAGITDSAGKDCAYKYTYSGGGIGVFSHCTSYTATYDSEDSLIDVYTPQDAFYIKQGESRLSVINRLLGYTGCIKRIENDEQIHVFVPTVSGVSYDYQYAQSASHPFYSNINQKALIIPNKITVESFPDDASQYTGNATDATSYALLPVEDFIQMKLVSNAQATSIASARIGQLQRAAQNGQASVPMNVGAEIHDYVLITDAWRNDTRTGNIGSIYWHYKPTTFEMVFAFGKLTTIPVPGTRLSLLADIQKQIEQAQQAQAEEVSRIWRVVQPSLDIIVDGIDTNFRIVDERLDRLDKWGQDVSKFLTWLQSNLVIAPDEANFTVNSLINQITTNTADIATNTALFDDVTVSEPSRTLDTVYQNTSGKIRMVTISIQVSTAQTPLLVLKSDSSNPPTTVRAQYGFASYSAGDFALALAGTMFVLPSHYYMADIIGTATLLDWHEWDLH